jgi:G protein beta subunit-like protein
MPSKILVTAGYDHTIRLWEVASGQCYRTIQFPDSQVNTLAITPNRQFVAAGGHTQIRLFELASNNAGPTTTFNGHKGNVVSLGFTKESRIMYSGSEDGCVKIWDLRNTNALHDFEYKEPCTSVVLHPDQKFLFASYQNGEVRILDYQTLLVKHSFFPDGETSIQSITVDPSGRQLCAVNNKGICMVYQIDPSFESFSLIKKWKAHDRYILKCLYSPNGKMLATTSADHSAKIWETNDFSEHKTLNGHQRWVWDCTFSADSTYFVTVSSDTTGRLWDLSQGETVKHFAGHRKAVTCVALHDTDPTDHT